MTTVTINKKGRKNNSWWFAFPSTVSLVISIVFISFSLLHFKSFSWISCGTNLIIIDLEIKRSQKRRLCGTGRIELLELWGFGEGTTSAHENHMVVCREVPISRDFPVSWEEDEIIDAAVKETSVIQNWVTWGIPSRDVLMSSDEAVVEPCVKTTATLDIPTAEKGI